MKKITVNLDTKSIKEAIDELEKYRMSLKAKTKEFVDRLLDEGIKVAEQNVGDYGGFIIFEKEIEGDTQCVGLLVARDRQKVIREWQYYGYSTKTVEISPILFAEFGSGFLAEVLFPVPGVGQGTFPGQEHAFEPGGWSWMDLDGKWHHSKGEKPTHPMYQADMEMINSILRIAKEVFTYGI